MGWLVPKELEDIKQSILKDNPDMGESQAYAIATNVFKKRHSIKGKTTEGEMQEKASEYVRDKLAEDKPTKKGPGPGTTAAVTGTMGAGLAAAPVGLGSLLSWSRASDLKDMAKRDLEEAARLEKAHAPVPKVAPLRDPAFLRRLAKGNMAESARELKAARRLGLMTIPAAAVGGLTLGSLGYGLHKWDEKRKGKTAALIRGRWVWTGGKDLPRWATQKVPKVERFLQRELGMRESTAKAINQMLQKLKGKPGSYSQSTLASNIRHALAELKP